jgi:hypothetical protein
MSPSRAPDPDPNAEAHQRRHAAAKARKLLREGMAQLQAVLDDRFIIEETPLEATGAMQLAADAMYAALHQPDAADSMFVPAPRHPQALRRASKGSSSPTSASMLQPVGLAWRQAMPTCSASSTSRRL